MITKAERTELRSIVRQQFKVLRHEVEERRAELYQEVEEELAARFAEADKQWNDVIYLANQAVLEANRKVHDILHEAGFEAKGDTETQLVWVGKLTKPSDDRQQLRRTATARIESQVKSAGLRLDREEADLLRTLGIGALESEEARTFLENIPTVGQLVSSQRLSELEASLGGSQNGN